MITTCDFPLREWLNVHFQPIILLPRFTCKIIRSDFILPLILVCYMFTRPAVAHIAVNNSTTVFVRYWSTIHSMWIHRSSRFQLNGYLTVEMVMGPCQLSNTRSFRNSTSSRVENQLKTIKLRPRKVEKESCNSQPWNKWEIIVVPIYSRTIVDVGAGGI